MLAANYSPEFSRRRSRRNRLFARTAREWLRLVTIIYLLAQILTELHKMDKIDKEKLSNTT